MQGKVLIIFTLLTTLTKNSYAVIGEESVILSGILAQQIQAVAGISTIITDGKEQIEEIKELKNAYDSFEDKRAKAERALYYVERLGRFKDDRQKIKSLVEVRNNLQDGKDLYDNRHDLTLGKKILAVSGDHATETAISNSETQRMDRSELNRLQLDSQRAKTGANYTKVGADASVFTAAQTQELNQKMNSLILYQSSLMKVREVEIERQNYEEFLIQRRWGLIPNMSYSEYIKLASNR